MPQMLSAVLMLLPVAWGAGDHQAHGQWRDPSPHEVRSVTVDSSVRLEVLDWGGEGPPLVLLGCYLSAHAYDDFAPKLTNEIHVYGLTRRGIRPSDTPPTGYTVQRSSDDLREVLDALAVPKAVLLGTSCAGQVQTLFAAQHPDRVVGLIYLDGAGDPTMLSSDPPMPDLKELPPLAKPPGAADNRSFDAHRAWRQRTFGVTFPEAELRHWFETNPDGSVGRYLLSPSIRKAITSDARIKPDSSRVKAPVLALYQADPPFEDVAARYAIASDQQRAVVRQMYHATRSLYTQWQRDLRAAIPTARIVEVPGATVYMFASDEAAVLSEVRPFAARLRGAR